MKKELYEEGDRVVVRNEGRGSYNGKKLGKVVEVGHNSYGLELWYRIRFDGTTQREDPYGYLHYPSEIISLVGNDKGVESRRERVQRERLRQIEKLVSALETNYCETEWEAGVEHGKLKLAREIRTILHGKITLKGEEDV